MFDWVSYMLIFYTFRFCSHGEESIVVLENMLSYRFLRFLPVEFIWNQLYPGFHVCKNHLQRQARNYLIIKPLPLVCNPNKTFAWKSLKEKKKSLQIVRDPVLKYLEARSLKFYSFLQKTCKVSLQNSLGFLCIYFS